MHYVTTFLGDVWGPRGVIRGAAVPAGAPEVLVRLTLRPRTPLRLSGLHQLHQSHSGCSWRRHGIHGASSFQRGHPELLTPLPGLQQQPAEEELAQHETRPNPGASKHRGQSGEAAGQSDGRGRRRGRGRTVRCIRTQSRKQKGEL